MVNLVQSLLLIWIHIAMDTLEPAASFSPTPWGSRRRTGTSSWAWSSFSSSSHNNDNGDWIDLTDNTNGGVQKRILVEGSGESYPSVTSVATKYMGTLESADWSVTEVWNCWLSEQQGLDHLGDGFCQEQVDEAKLTDLDVFTEAFVQDTLGVTAKIASKKLVLAAKQLATARQEYPPGMQFDSNDNYEFILALES